MTIGSIEGNFHDGRLTVVTGGRLADRKVSVVANADGVSSSP